MRGMDVKRRMMYLAMLIFLFSCGQHLPLGVEEELYRGEEKGGVLAITIDNVSPQTARTIAPAHIDAQQLQTNYDLKLSGTTGYQGFPEEVITIDNTGGATLRKIPAGEWELTLTAYNKTGNAATLRGRTTVTVTDLEITPVSFTLTPLFTGNGTGNVSVQFTIPQGIASRLDTTNGNKQVTVALYYDEIDAEVQGTRQVFNLSTTSATTFTYTQRDVPEGQYSIRLSASYTVNNASTLYQNLTHAFGYRDIVYVENNRDSTGSVTFPDTVLGVPNMPYRKDRYNSSGSSASVNFASTNSFSPWKETVWLWGAAWDGDGNTGNGNEILVVDWDPVYNADYYEVEVLLHPLTRTAATTTANGKFPKVITNDADWDDLRRQTFGGKPPVYMAYSGGIGDPNYYKTKHYIIDCNTNDKFLSCADKTYARTLFPNKGEAVGKVNANYQIAAAQDAFDNYTDFTYGTFNRGKVGLEGDCGVLGILVPSFSPQASLVFRVRAVNEYGYSDWVYWKGGKWAN